MCPFGAVERHGIRDQQGELIRAVAGVTAGVCQGCGTCQASWPSKSVELDGFADEQIFAQINAVAG